MSGTAVAVKMNAASVGNPAGRPNFHAIRTPVRQFDKAAHVAEQQRTSGNAGHFGQFMPICDTQG